MLSNSGSNTDFSFGNVGDSAIIGNLIDIASLGFSFEEQAIISNAGLLYASDIFLKTDAELRNLLGNNAVMDSISRIKTECRKPLTGRIIFSNKVMNLLIMGNITTLEQLMNTSCRYLNSIPNFNWADMFEIIQKLDILFGKTI